MKPEVWSQRRLLSSVGSLQAEDFGPVVSWGCDGERRLPESSRHRTGRGSGPLQGSPGLRFYLLKEDELSIVRETIGAAGTSWFWISAVHHQQNHRKKRRADLVQTKPGSQELLFPPCEAAVMFSCNQSFTKIKAAAPSVSSWGFYCVVLTPPPHRSGGVCSPVHGEVQDLGAVAAELRQQAAGARVPQAQRSVQAAGGHHRGRLLPLQVDDAGLRVHASHQSRLNMRSHK